MANILIERIQKELPAMTPFVGGLKVDKICIADVFKPFENFVNNVSGRTFRTNRSFVAEKSRSAGFLPLPRKISPPMRTISDSLWLCIPPIWDYCKKHNIELDEGLLEAELSSDNIYSFLGPFADSLPDDYMGVCLEDGLSSELGGYIPTLSYQDPISELGLACWQGAEYFTPFLQRTYDDMDVPLSDEDRELVDSVGLSLIVDTYSKSTLDKMAFIGELTEDVKREMFSEAIAIDEKAIDEDVITDNPTFLTFTSVEVIEYYIAYHKGWDRLMESFPTEIYYDDWGEGMEEDDEYRLKNTALLIADMCKIYRKETQEIIYERAA